MEFNATFLVSAISFIVFTILMNKVLYAPLEKVVTERENFINANYSDAKNKEDSAKSLLQDVANRIAASRIDAKKIQDKKLSEAGRYASEIVKEAKLEMDQFIEEQKSSISRKINAVNVNTAELADMITEKFLNNRRQDG